MSFVITSPNSCTQGDMVCSKEFSSRFRWDLRLREFGLHLNTISGISNFHILEILSQRFKERTPLKPDSRPDVREEGASLGYKILYTLTTPGYCKG